MHDAVLMAWQGSDEFFAHGQNLSGWMEFYLSSGGNMDDRHHDNDHKISNFLKHYADQTSVTTDKVAVVTLRGKLATGVVNPPASVSPIWKPVPEDPKSPRIQQVFSEYRRETNLLLASMLKNESSTVYPLDRLIQEYPQNVQVVFPNNNYTNAAAAAADFFLHDDEFIKNDRSKWNNSQDWQPRTLPNLAIVVRRSPPSERIISCKRCIQNVQELAQSVATNLDMVTLLVYFTYDMPLSLQAYLFHSTRLLVAMHGGSWSHALGMASDQAAVEIVPWGLGRTNVRHFMSLTGCAYESLLCSNCTKYGSWFVDKKQVIQTAKRALLRAEQVYG